MDRIKNVIVVVIDALRADRVGAVGGRSGLTPNIDALARRGTAFENAYTPASNTDPSITSLLTGRYPLNTVYHHGKLVTDDEKRRIESVKSLPMMLSAAGWKTAVVGQSLGRWHSRGFDHYPETGMDDRAWARVMEVARRAFDAVNATAPTIGSAIRSLYNAPNRKMKPAVIMQDYNPTELLSYVGSEPFFGVVHLMETHKPYLGTTEDFDDLLARGEYPEESIEDFFEGKNATDTQYRHVVDSLDTLGLDRPGELIALYDAAVRYADRKVGRLVEELRRSGLWEDTALFVTADHGESLLDHGIFLSHHGLYEEVFHVPLICTLGDGNRIGELVQLTDLAPTILDLLGVDGPPMDGKSLVELIDGARDQEGRQAAFAEEAYYQRRTAIRTDRWKYLRHTPDEAIEAERGSSLECGYCETVHGSERELYDLDTDPDEHHNVIDDHPDVVKELETIYETFESGLVEPIDTDDDIRYEHEDDVLDRLEAIGYR